MKKVEDYEPISGVAVCVAIACVLGVTVLTDGLSNPTQSEHKKVEQPIVKKVSSQPVVPANIKSKEKERSRSE